ncbi:MAG: AAA family ATPase [Holophagales bacterium]|nr:AAA family ATPase [Holophagales bacterium]
MSELGPFSISKMLLFDACPKAPDWHVPWDAIHEAYPWIRDLRGCPQNPRYHGEGDVWIHTRMVCESMAGLESWRRLPAEEREDLFAAALLHDAAKPECTKVQEDGRVTSRGHARKGALLARRILWHQGADVERRERICSLVRHHMVPLYLRDSEGRERQIRTLSQVLRCEYLHLLCRADAEGRVCEDPEDMRRRHEAYEHLCRRLGCFDRPYSFESEHGRFLYLRHLTEDPALSGEVEGPEVVMMAGLPGSPKQRWIETNTPSAEVIDLDDLRRQLGVAWSDNQGSVVAAARDLARAHLDRGEGFVWCDMNLGRKIRDHLVELFARHGARIRIVHLEAEPGLARDLLHRRGYGDGELDELLARWEVPDPTEAHRVELLPISRG